METSSFFERSLFYERSPAANEYFIRSAGSIFEADPQCSKIEVRIQSKIDVSSYERRHESKTQPYTLRNEKTEPDKAVFSGPSDFADVKHKVQITPKYELKKPYEDQSNKMAHHPATIESDASSMLSEASSTALSTALDHHQGSLPPTYPGPPKLIVLELDTERIQDFVNHTRNDFRVFYIRQRHSYSRLQITKEFFDQLLNSCHVFPRFSEYLIGFGVKSTEYEVGPPPLNFRPLRSVHSNKYHGFECSYILRYIEYTNRPEASQPWSLRQFAVYHRFKPKADRGCSTWILVGASQRTEVVLDQYTRTVDNLTNTNPFELHVMFLDIAMASWREYLVNMTQLVTRQSDKAMAVAFGSGKGFTTIDVEDHQELKHIEDQIADLMLCLDSTLDTVGTFGDMYAQFVEHHSHSDDAQTAGGLCRSAPGTDAVQHALRTKSKEITYTRKKAEALLSKVQTTRTLILSLLERDSGHKLQLQIKQGAEESIIMRHLTEKTSRDSSSMRILTIITMIYLPCTIVSNFYSTQFVTQTELPSGGSKLRYTSNTYVFFAISIPLTLVTILVWYCWMNAEEISQFLWRCFFRKGGTTPAGSVGQHTLLPQNRTPQWAASPA